MFGGIPEKAVKKAFHEKEIYVSPALLDEYRSTPLKLNKQGKINHQQLKILIAGIAAFVTNAKIVQPSEKVSVCRDPKDDMLLECCATAKAEVLITSDKDLLAIKDLPFDFEIVTPGEFSEKY